MISCYAYDTPLCRLGIYADENALLRIEFHFCRSMEAVYAETPLIQKAFAQISEYLEGKRKTFDLPFAVKGTEFQKRVWDSLIRIPYGETRSYKEVAVSIGNEQAARAVGMANNRNQLPLLIPCHRVIGADGSLVGFGFGGIEVKKKLLQLEKAACNGKTASGSR